MKRIFGAILIGTFLLCGCGDNSGQASPDAVAAKRIAYRGPTTAESQEIVATVRGDPITMQQLMEPLIESRGLLLLANLVQLDLAKQAAAKAHVTVTQEDFDREYNLTLERAFKDKDDAKLVDAIDKADQAKDATLAATLREQLHMEREDYLAQTLTNTNVDRVDFNIVLKTNTYLRKVAEPQVSEKIGAEGTETRKEALRKVFGQLYGERIEVEYIQLPSMTQVAVAQRRLATGDNFEQVAKDMSTDPRTAPLGGALPPFSREMSGASQVFKDAAFSLRDGQVSDAVAIGSSFALIKRLKLDPPQAVKFENVEQHCYEALHDALMDVAMKEMQRQLAFEARTEIDIVHPVLARQWQEKIARETNASERATKELDKDQVRKDLRRLTPTTAPAADTAIKANGAAPGERPPATQPGEAPTPPAK